jgi:hypothetical protein
VEERVEWPLVHGGRAVLHALRGEPDQAAGAFDHALALCGEVDLPWFEAVLRALRAEFTAAFDPQQAQTEAHLALDWLASTGDRWWPAWAERGRALADAALGAGSRSADALQALLAQDLNPLERARTLQALGEVRLGFDDRSGAAQALEEALPLFEVSGARYGAFRTLHRLPGPPRPARRAPRPGRRPGRRRPRLRPRRRRSPRPRGAGAG